MDCSAFRLYGRGAEIYVGPPEQAETQNIQIMWIRCLGKIFHNGNATLSHYARAMRPTYAVDAALL